MKNTDYEEDSESLIDLPFHEDMISQPYLSLGLTPLSQLSPDPVNSIGGDYGFFPSMLPPVSAIAPVINGGMQVEELEMDNLVMPEAMPMSYSVTEPRKLPRRVRDVRGEGMTRAFSNSKLEPVVEQSSLETDEYSTSRTTTSNSHENTLTALATTNLIELKNSSSSYDEDDIPTVFPSANATPPIKGANYPQNWVHSKDNYIDDVWSSESPPKPSSNGALPPSSFAAASKLQTSYQPGGGYDNREEVRMRRQKARQEAMAAQRESLAAQKNEEELRKVQRQKALLSSFGRQGTVLKQAAIFDAREELSHETPTLLPRATPGLQSNLFSPTSFPSQHRTRHSNDFDFGMLESDLKRTTNYKTVL